MKDDTNDEDPNISDGGIACHFVCHISNEDHCLSLLDG
jgi:hypothetical protein